MKLLLSGLEHSQVPIALREGLSFPKNRVRELDRAEPRELEALYLLDGKTYLHIQLRDEGYDYTLYDERPSASWTAV